METGKISKVDVLTIVIAFTALLASVSSMYFQFFNNSTELSVKFTGTSVENLEETFESEISFLFLNTGNTEVALISGFIYLSVDRITPRHDFSGDREHLDENEKKWWTQTIDLETSILINSGKITNNKFKFTLSREELLKFLGQNFDLKSKKKVEFYTGVSLNFIDSKGKFKMKKITPSLITLKYNFEGDSLSFHGSGSNVNQSEMKQVINKYVIF